MMTTKILEMTAMLEKLIALIKSKYPAGEHFIARLTRMERDEELCTLLKKVNNNFMERFVEKVNRLLEGYEEFGEKYEELVAKKLALNKALKAPDNIKKNDIIIIK